MDENLQKVFIRSAVFVLIFVVTVALVGWYLHG